MERAAMQELYIWKEKKNKKPLVIRGARQVGKTWLMKTFGKQAYAQQVYINFDNNAQMQQLFEPDFDITRIITGLELYAGHKIEADNTILIFDEVQEVPKVLASLKYFNENAPQYQIVCAGSLLGVALHPGASFPVGKVEFMDLYPLSFTEFMQAMGKAQYVEQLHKHDFGMVTAFKQTYMEMLRYYFYIGGMPEVVQHFSETRDFAAARDIQQHILDAYEQDFSKHAPNETVPRIRMVWNSIPAQLARENKKFIYGLLKEGARAKEYEQALMWLTDCGLVHKVHRVTTPGLPLKAYEDLKAFKVFVVDVGLLSCMAELRPEVLLEGDAVFEAFKGAITEQYVLQQLKTRKHVQPYYWSGERATAEVDFLIDSDGVIPIEVKAGINLKAKSLRVYREKFAPRLCVRTSMADYQDDGWLINLPLYAVETIREVTKA